MHKSQCVSNQILLNLGFLIPTAVLFIPFFLFISCLWRHARQTLIIPKAWRPQHSENTMISLLASLVVHHLATLLTVLSSSIPEISFSVIISETVAPLYPSMHPIHIILRNRKLRHTSVNLLRQTESRIRGI